jgi:glutathione synthase
MSAVDHRDAHVEPATLIPEDWKICAELAPELCRLRLLRVGIDLIGDQLIEVNVTSPTGLREIEALTAGRHDTAALDFGERLLR